MKTIYIVVAIAAAIAIFLYLYRGTAPVIFTTIADPAVVPPAPESRLSLDPPVRDSVGAAFRGPGGGIREVSLFR